MNRTRNRAAAIVVVVAVGTLFGIAVGQNALAKDALEPRPIAGGESPPLIAAAPAGVGEIPFVSARAAAVQTPSAPGAWGGERTGKEATLSDRVVDYTIQATLDPKAHILDGKEKLVWRNRSDRAVKSIYLHLYLNAFEGPGSTFFSERRENQFEFRSDVPVKKGGWGHIELRKVQQGGQDVPWTFVHPDGGPASDHTVVRLDLPAEVAPGARATVELDFRDQLPRVIARTGWFGSFHMIAQWFPKVGVLELAGERGATAPRWNVHEFHLHSEFYADWASYDVTMTVPKDFQVASAGEEQGAPVEKDGLATHHFVQGDVHDFAWMAAGDFAPPLVGSYDGAGSPHVTVKVFFPPEYRATAAPALKAGIDSIKFFSETLGPYPYRTSTIIVPPYNATEAGGMEYQTIYTASGFETVEPDTAIAAALDFVTIHEFGHGYFYGLLASNEFEEPLLDEGLNEYWDMRMVRARNQAIHLTTPFLKMIGFDATLSGFEFERAGGALDPHPADPIGANAWDRMSSGSYGQVYSRTATVMHDLEERLGHEATERAFKLYYQRWHFRHPSTADLREALAEGSGDRRSVEQVFRQNVYAVEAIDDRVQSLSSNAMKPEPGTTFKDGKWTEETEEDVHKRIKKDREAWKKEHPDAKHGEGPYPYRTVVIVRRDGARVPETMVVKFADDSTETVHWDDDRLWHRFTFIKPVKATSAEIDPERHRFLDSDKLNDGRVAEPDGRASRRWTGDLAAIVEVLYSVWGSL